MNRRCIALAVLSLPAASCGGSDPGVPTFSKNIAPILYDNCVTCHRAGGIGPFSLATYADARRHASQIAFVTETRYMPPWPPAKGDHPLLGERTLEASQIGLIRGWVDAGAPEGEPSERPPVPLEVDGWQLGEPDLVVRMPRPYTLSADGADRFRNFVVPVPLDRARFVRAIELLPGNPKIVHHAQIMIDTTPACRKRDALDPEPGFDGMEMGAARPPDGHLLGWTPGKRPVAIPEDMAFRLGPGTDLVVQLHMLPTGKPEPIQPRVGLFFTDRRPTRRPSLVILSSNEIDIPAGEENYRIEDEIELPVPVELLGVYPHAHYLGKEILALAVLPGGGTETLLHIPDWDFSWQDEYRFANPVRLPAGTTLRMEFRYDNSRSNARNPYDPPRRVVHGQRSVDEMGTLMISMTARDESDRALLAEAKARHALKATPGDPYVHNDLGNAAGDLGRLEEAIGHYRRAIELASDLADPHYNLGVVLAETGDLEGAEREYERAIEHEPEHARAYNNLGKVLLAQQRGRAARERFEQAVALQPDLAVAHYNLGLAEAALGESESAAAHYRRAIEVDPTYAPAYSDLGVVLFGQGEFEAAIRAFRDAIRADPWSADAHNNLGFVLARSGRVDEAIASYRNALRADPDFERARNNLAELLANTP